MGKCGSGIQCPTKVYTRVSAMAGAPSPRPSSLTCLLADNFWSHVWHEPDGELANHFPRNHGLGPRPRKGAFDPMQGKRRVPPSVHQDVFLQKTTKWVRGQHCQLTKETAMASGKVLLVAHRPGVHTITGRKYRAWRAERRACPKCALVPASMHHEGRGSATLRTASSVASWPHCGSGVLLTRRAMGFPKPRRIQGSVVVPTDIRAPVEPEAPETRRRRAAQCRPSVNFPPLSPLGHRTQG